MINTAERLRVETKMRAVLLALSLLYAPFAAADYSNHPQAEPLIDRVAARGGLDRILDRAERIRRLDAHRRRS